MKNWRQERAGQVPRRQVTQQNSEQGAEGAGQGQKARTGGPCGLRSQNRQGPPGRARTWGGVKKAAMSFDLVFKGTLSFVWTMSLRGLVGGKETV